MPGLSLYIYILANREASGKLRRISITYVTEYYNGRFVLSLFSDFLDFRTISLPCASWGYWHTGAGLQMVQAYYSRREPTPIFELLTNVLGG